MQPKSDQYDLIKTKTENNMMKYWTLSGTLLLVVLLASGCRAQLTGTMDSAYPSTSDNKLLCMAEMVSNIEKSCSQPDVQGYYVALEALLKQFLGKCFQTNFTQNRALHVMMPDLGDRSTEWLKAQADLFKDQSQVEDVVPTFVPATQINAEVEFMLQHNLANSHDGWIMDPSGFGIVSKYGGFYDLTAAVNSPLLGLDWPDVLPLVRQRHVAYKGEVVAFPLDLNANLLFYNRDALAALNATQPPRTWQQLADMAARANMQRVNNQTMYGICLERRKDCHTQTADLFSIVAPLVQSQGTVQGVFFDPDTLPSGNTSSILTGSRAFTEALQLYVALTASAPPANVSDKCDTPARMVDLFRQGRCAFMYGYDVFKRLNDSSIRGKVGVEVLPGSEQVLDRRSDTLVACTPETCPYGDTVTDEATGASRRINIAPFLAEGGWVSAVNKRSPSEYQNISAAFFAFLSTPNTSWSYVSNPAFRFEPYRTSHLLPERWLAAGYDANDTAQYLQALQRTVRLEQPGLGGNAAMDLRIPGTKYFRELFENAAANATSGTNLVLLAGSLTQAVSRLLNDPQKIMAQYAEVVDAYLSTIQVPLAPQPPSVAPPPDSRSGSPSWLPIAIVLPTVGALLLIAAAVVYEVRNNRKHKNLFGKVLPPGLGAETSILVASVQDLAALLGALPAPVMEAALREYGEVVRKLLLRHSGYECAMEDGGATFTLAFHSPKDALLFAMEAQHMLLNAAWPAELLEARQCAPTYVQGMAAAKPKNLQDILDVGDPAVSGPTPAGYVSTAHSRIKALAAGLTGHRQERDATPADHMAHVHGVHGRHMGMASSGPTIPALVNVPTSETYTFSIACQRAWKDTSTSDPTKVLIFRGLRVHMGVHAGIHNPDDIQPAKGEAGAIYSGETIRLARAVCEAAHGGMVLLSEETYKKLPLERLWDRYLVLHVGEHRLVHEGLPPLNLYHALNRTLEGRLAYLGPVRTSSQLDPGVLDAPVGCVTVAFMNVVGAQTLLSWNADIAQQALKVFHGVVGEELKACRGYLVEAVDGLFLAAFQRPAEAILWALECNEHMIKQDWPDELLAHELCEELVISAPTKEGEVVNTVVFRGLRLKTGVDTGQVLGEVHAMTGRMTYRGKVMNRAARVASTASTGQVLCSSDSWGLATANDAHLITSNKVTATSLGQFRLKGVAEKIEIYHCRKVSSVAPARRASSLVVSMADHWKWKSIGPEDMLLGPGDSLRAAMLAPQAYGHDHGYSGADGDPSNVLAYPHGERSGQHGDDDTREGDDDDDNEGDHEPGNGKVASEAQLHLHLDADA